MSEKEMDEMLAGLREGYNPPPEAPREEMWLAIQARLKQRQDGVVPIGDARRIRTPHLRRTLVWAMGAAALVVLGLGIGRITAPGPISAPETAGVIVRDPDVIRMAALDHLQQTESLLSLVRADARSGGDLTPGVGSWARGLLGQTRLLMDADGDLDPAMKDLLEDLELVLVQLVGVVNTEKNDPVKVRSELNLALGGMDERDVLPRIQAVTSIGPRFAGT